MYTQNCKTGNKTASINVKKLQFIHMVNGDRLQQNSKRQY